MAYSPAQNLIDQITGLPDEFTPELAVEYIRDLANSHDDDELHLLGDLIEALWDEVQRLRRLMD